MMKKFFLALAFFALADIAHAQDPGTTQGPLPRILASPVRVTPVLGASSFNTRGNLDNVTFDQGFSGGVLADIGPTFYTFQTGILALNSSGAANVANTSVTINSWGVPLLARFNFSGKPQETAFVKAGAMPFQATGGANTNFDVMAVGGIGGNIPIGRTSSILLDASYNRLFTRAGNLTDYNGIALLAGLSMNL